MPTDNTNQSGYYLLYVRPNLTNVSLHYVSCVGNLYNVSGIIEDELSILHKLFPNERIKTIVC